MRVTARTSRNTRISGGPVFWLLAGPFILTGYLLIGAFMLLSIAGAAIVASAQHIQTARKAKRRATRRR
ncbi:MAG TPA: hypothetical protein VN714_12745 [Trebonia sp.]|nr:hypothetical protein [Trebonia sp.]